MKKLLLIWCGVMTLQSYASVALNEFENFHYEESDVQAAIFIIENYMQIDVDDEHVMEDVNKFGVLRGFIVPTINEINQLIVGGKFKEAHALNIALGEISLPIAKEVSKITNLHFEEDQYIDMLHLAELGMNAETPKQIFTTAQIMQDFNLRVCAQGCGIGAAIGNGIGSLIPAIGNAVGGAVGCAVGCGAAHIGGDDPSAPKTPQTLKKPEVPETPITNVGTGGCDEWDDSCGGGNSGDGFQSALPNWLTQDISFLGIDGEVNSGAVSGSGKISLIPEYIGTGMPDYIGNGGVGAINYGTFY